MKRFCLFIFSLVVMICCPLLMFAQQAQTKTITICPHYLGSGLNCIKTLSSPIIAFCLCGSEINSEINMMTKSGQSFGPYNCLAASDGCETFTYTPNAYGRMPVVSDNGVYFKLIGHYREIYSSIKHLPNTDARKVICTIAPRQDRQAYQSETAISCHAL